MRTMSRYRAMRLVFIRYLALFLSTDVTVAWVKLCELPVSAASK